MDAEKASLLRAALLPLFVRCYSFKLLENLDMSKDDELTTNQHAIKILENISGGNISRTDRGDFGPSIAQQRGTH